MSDQIIMSLDRNWISGFTDGEGCFYLLQNYRANNSRINREAEFQICLRNDDVEVLHKIRDTFGCGSIDTQKRVYKKEGNGKPCASYRVSKLGDLIGYIIPHFEQYPLQSKKAHDFVVWKAAVELMWDVQQQQGSRRTSRAYRETIWEQEESLEFERLVRLLKSTREYKSV